jgi:hypothetical protein
MNRFVKDGEVTCTGCGAVYARFSQHFPMGDSDSIKCECGTVLEQWSGGFILRFDLISKGRSRPDADKPSTR